MISIFAENAARDMTASGSPIVLVDAYAARIQAAIDEVTAEQKARIEALEKALQAVRDPNLSYTRMRSIIDAVLARFEGEDGN